MRSHIGSLGRRAWRLAKANLALSVIIGVILLGAGLTAVVPVRPAVESTRAASPAQAVPVPTCPVGAYGCTITAPSVSTLTTTHVTDATVSPGQPFGDSATVTSPVGAPSGSVNFFLCGPMTSDSTCTPGPSNGVGGAETLVAGAGNSSTTTSPTVTEGTVGVYCFAAVYTPSPGSVYVGSSDNTPTSVPVTASVSDNECVNVAPSPRLVVTKASSPPSGSKVLRGTLVTYSLIATNVGGGMVSNALVDDKVPVGTTYVSGSASCDGLPGCSATFDSADNTVEWSGLDLSSGTSGTLSFEVTVNNTDHNAMVISNTADFTNVGDAPACTSSMCPTNTVHLTVSVPTTAPILVITKPIKKVTTTPLAKIPSSTTVHTGEPWSGSTPYEAGVVVVGFGLIAEGLRRRRHLRSVPRHLRGTGS